MIKRNRVKQVMIQSVDITDMGVSGVMVVGDVHGPCTPFVYSETYAGYRGEESFVTAFLPEPQNNRLNYNNQEDEDVRDSNIWGNSPESFRENILAPFEEV